jgi:Putative prokaryotic signal transducing protein
VLAGFGDVSGAMMGPMNTVVAVVGSRTEADIIVGMLQSNGVPASLSADDAGGNAVNLMSQGVAVLVPDERADDARKLISESDGPPAPPAKQNAFQRWMVKVLGGGRPTA